ncbi:hypothetical protein EMGBS15_10960 [Filimonas sp.]|nr:hypothetical protein EMGBS15_10960 [Filimonas sp.]
MKPSILILYYSQTGQLRSILDSIFSDQKELCEIDIQEIKPVRKFPFPWKAAQFFDCMPESVLQIPEEIEPIHITEKNYDLIVLGYQPWFLSPSIPFSSFLKSNQAEFLRNKNIMTVIGSRNMWLNAQEKTKAGLLEKGANLVGNLVFFDKNPNLTSILTIIRWTFKGQKEATKRMPEAGVQKKDIEAANRFGNTIIQTIKENKVDELHKKLLTQDGVELNPALVILEKRGIKNFKKFATYIREKGERGDEARSGRVKLFSRLLFVGVFILSPISSFTASLAVLFNKNKLMKEVDYFKNITFKEKAI